jgi:Kdo2-lipid IVA 3' secondary acyltransferase
LFDGYAGTNRFWLQRQRAVTRRGCFLEGTAEIDCRPAGDTLEFNSRTERCDVARGRSDCAASHSFLLQPPRFGNRNRRHGSLAYSRSNWATERSHVSLGREESETQEKLKIEGWLARWLIAFGYWLLQIWARTLRYEVDDRAGVIGKPVRENYIAALWHNRLLLISFALKKFLPQRPGAGLISASRDGDLIADLTQRFGFEVVRGSSSRLGASALRELENVLASGHDVLITPDGPRGPAYELGPGIVFLAQKTGAAVVPINMEYSGCWRVNSWDGFILPRPFARVRVIFGPPHRVRATSTSEEFEAERLSLQKATMALVEMR